MDIVFVVSFRYKTFDLAIECQQIRKLLQILCCYRFQFPYCIGQIDAYFADDIPDDFWMTLAVYAAHASLYSIKWAEKFGQEEIEGMATAVRVAAQKGK